ncbi:unnamed protein product [Peniophora sp. CBMAI 1063]|nr:unnamed protein product [Peniophora sp. CBMAI 1063]
MPPNPHSGLLDMFPEIISMIGRSAQDQWLAEIFDEHRASSSIRRSSPPLVIDQADCRGVTAGLVTDCLKDSVAQITSPAHILMHTSSYLRHVLLADKALCTQTNTLLHELTLKASGRHSVPPSLAAVGARFRYGSDVLVADKVCSCLLLGIRDFYPTLRFVKVSLPWDDVAQPDRTCTSDFFARHHSEDSSPLEYFDLEIFEDVQDTPSYLSAFRSPHIRVCRVTNAAMFFFGPNLTVLYIVFPFGKRLCVGPSLLNALTTMSGLQSLTIDIGNSELIESHLGNNFHDAFPTQILLQRLLYLRLLLPCEVASFLLGRMVLPPGIDMHIEPVHDVLGGSLAEPQIGDIDVPRTIGNVVQAEDLWRFVAALLVPPQAPAAFSSPQDFITRSDGDEGHILRTLRVMAIDIRLDPLNEPPMEDGAGIPELVSLMIGSTTSDVEGMSGDVTRASRSKFGDPARTRRSLSFRNMERSAEQRMAGVALLPHAASLLSGEIARFVLDGQVGTPFTGLVQISCLLIDGNSWLPTNPLDWVALLAPFDGIQELRFMAPACKHDLACEGGPVHGSVTTAHMESLAQAIGNAGATQWLVPRVTVISLPNYTSPHEDIASLRSALEDTCNSPQRLAGRAAVVRWVFGG